MQTYIYGLAKPSPTENALNAALNYDLLASHSRENALYIFGFFLLFAISLAQL